jgi:hypothetical protein
MSEAQLVAAQSVPLPPQGTTPRFIEFFTANVRNKNTRAAYARAAADFLYWCEGQGIGELGRVQSAHVAAYIELLRGALGSLV